MYTPNQSNATVSRLSNPQALPRTTFLKRQSSLFGARKEWLFITGCFLSDVSWDFPFACMASSSITGPPDDNRKITWVGVLFFPLTYVHVDKAAFIPLFSYIRFLWGFPGGLVVRNPLANAGDMGSMPRLGRSPGEGNDNPLQYSCLENSVHRGAWWASLSSFLNMKSKCCK